jgi:hypothetical protein
VQFLLCLPPPLSSLLFYLLFCPVQIVVGSSSCIAISLLCHSAYVHSTQAEFLENIRQGFHRLFCSANLHVAGRTLTTQS